jgi:D-sedoheptulose 7-phosphate isomerase
MKTSDNYVAAYLHEAARICQQISGTRLEKIVDELVALRANGGRLFLLGVGGSAANASHAVNDFRKLADIEAYTPTDNVSELTARINDDGWDSSYVQWLRGSRLKSRDAIFVLSVGGGSVDKRVSLNLVEAVRYSHEVGARVFGIVGRDGGYTAQNAHACLVVPSLNPATLTPQTEGFQSILLHLIVSHPKLLAREMKWESLSPSPAATTAKEPSAGHL